MLRSTSRRQFLLTSAALLGAGACGPAPQQAVPPTPTLTPSASPAASRKVIIVGGGISGLAIAFDLVGRGFDPVVLEASSRPGGRIQTIRAPFPEGLHVEAGATHVLPDPDLLKLMDAVGVEVTPRKRGGGSRSLSQVYLQGDKRLVLGADDDEPEQFPLSAEEKALGPFGPMNKYFALVKDIDITQPLPLSLLQYDNVNAEEFLRKQGASPGYMRGVADSFMPDEPLSRMSALFLMREIGNFMREIKLQGKGGRVKGGTDLFPAALAEKLGKRVIYGARVTRIEQTDSGVRVTFTDRGQSTIMEGGRAVSTLPSTVLREVEFSPALSPDKQRALRELTLVSVTRVWMGSKTRFWEAAHESGTVQSDAPLGTIRDETELQEGTSGILGLYTTGAEARRLAAMSEADRVKTAVAYGNRAHPGLDQQFTTGLSKCWDDDPLQRGAYAHFTTSQMTTLLPALMVADRRLHFAGDQTSHRPGFMHGALSAARRVVDEIVRAG